LCDFFLYFIEQHDIIDLDIEAPSLDDYNFPSDEYVGIGSNVASQDMVQNASLSDGGILLIVCQV
jgi:hypothetical protein